MHDRVGGQLTSYLRKYAFPGTSPRSDPAWAVDSGTRVHWAAWPVQQTTPPQTTKAQIFRAVMIELAGMQDRLVAATAVSSMMAFASNRENNPLKAFETFGRIWGYWSRIETDIRFRLSGTA